MKQMVLILSVFAMSSFPAFSEEENQRGERGDQSARGSEAAEGRRDADRKKQEPRREVVEKEERQEVRLVQLMLAQRDRTAL